MRSCVAPLRARTRAGRRSRTASASRSSSPPACTGRARSPPTAACRRARSRSVIEQLRDRRVVARAARRRPCARRAGRASRTPAAPSRRPGSRRPSARATSRTGSLQRGRAAPRHHRDLHRSPCRIVPLKWNVSGDLAVRQRVDVLGRRHLEVVRARRRRAGTRPRRGTRAPPCRPAPTGSCASSPPSARARRTARRAARAWRRRSCACAGSICSCARERDRVHVARRTARRPAARSAASAPPRAATGSAPSTSNAGRDASSAAPPAARAGPRGTARTASATPAPPEIPSQRGLHDADQPVGGVDRRDHVLRRRRPSRLTISASESGSSSQLRVGRARRSPTPRRSSSDSVAPAGLGYSAITLPRDRADHEEREPDRDLRTPPTARR